MASSDRPRPSVSRVRSAPAALAVVGAALLSGLLAAWSYSAERTLSVGTVFPVGACGWPATRASTSADRATGTAIAAARSAEQDAFAARLSRLAGRGDIVLLHEPRWPPGARRRPRAAAGVAAPRARRPHPPAGGQRERQRRRGQRRTLGADGTGNLADQQRQPIGLAIVTLRARPFTPLAVDLVSVAPGTGTGLARRRRLDEGPVNGLAAGLSP
ncbi:MAG: hypothetical protein ACR2KV_15385 [Solirubrobacteraceae bacterium]